MKPLLTLYLKELKEHRTFAALSLVVTICIQVVVFAKIDLPPGPGDMVLGFLAAISVGLPPLIAPFFLAHIYNAEWKGNTHYLTLSLPIPRWYIRLSKWGAVLSLSGFLYVIACGGLYILYLWIAGHLETKVYPIGFADFWVVAITWWVSISLLTLGLITAMEGLRSAIKRFRTVLAGGFLGICLLTFARLMDPASEALQFLGAYRYEIIGPGGLISLREIALSGHAFAAVYGLLMLALGLYLFNRFSEI
jgi:hypothetical protein